MSKAKTWRSKSQRLKKINDDVILENPHEMNNSFTKMSNLENSNSKTNKLSI